MSTLPPPQPPEPDHGAPAAPATCYRHPDRQTRLSCSSCRRPTCVDCTLPAAVGQKCPECAKPTGRNRVITAAEVRDRTSGLGGAPVSRAILYLTVGIGLLGFVARPAWAPLFVAFVHDVRLVADGEIWRSVTSALLHSLSPFHLLFNMWALYVFGPDLERRFGSGPFLAFYVAAAAAGGVAFQLTTDVGRAVGASGAIFGLFGAYVASAFLARHTAAGRAGLSQLMPLLLLNLALPLFIPNIAWQAHLGGLLAGIAIMAFWRTIPEAAGVPVRTGRTAMARTLIAGAVLVGSLVTLLVV